MQDYTVTFLGKHKHRSYYGDISEGFFFTFYKTTTDTK